MPLGGFVQGTQDVSLHAPVPPVPKFWGATVLTLRHPTLTRVGTPRCLSDRILGSSCFLLQGWNKGKRVHLGLGDRGCGGVGRDRPLLQAQSLLSPGHSWSARNVWKCPSLCWDMGSPRHRVHFGHKAILQSPAAHGLLWGSLCAGWAPPDSAFFLWNCTVHACGKNASLQPRGHSGATEQSDKLARALLLLGFKTAYCVQHPAAETYAAPRLNIGQQKTQE